MAHPVSQPDSAESTVMNRPLFLLGMTFLAVLICVNVLGPEAAVCLLLLSGIGLLLCAFVKRIRRTAALPPLLLASAAACLLFCTFWYSVYLPACSLASDEVPVRAQVISLPEERYGRTYYLLKTQEIAGEAQQVKLRLSCKKPLGLEPYDEVAGTLTVYQLGSGSDISARSWRARGVYLGGYAQGELSAEPAQSMPPYGYILRLRQWLGDAIEELLPLDEGAVLYSMLLGGTERLSNERISDFKTIGVMHLFAVSGLHLTVWSMLIQRLLKRARLSDRACALPAMAFVVFFMALSGFTPSVVRAGIMMLVYFSGFLIGREPDGLNSLGLAGLVVTVGNPFAAVSVSLLLSFFATLGILVFSRSISGFFTRGTRKIKVRALRFVGGAAAESVAVTLSALIFTYPICIMVFGYVSLIAPLANLLLALPAELAMVSIGLALLLRGSWLLAFLQYPFALFAGLLAKYMLAMAHALARVPFAALPADADYIPLWLAGSIGLFALVVLLSGHNKALYRLAACMSVATLLLSSLSYRMLEQDVTTVTVTDVGNGTAVLVTRNGESVLIGCGGDYRAGSSIASRLAKNQVDTLDFCLIPRDNDTEASALGEVMAAADPRQLLLPEQSAPFLDYLDRQGTQSAEAYAFEFWDGAAYLESLTGETTSCARLTVGQTRILFVFYPASDIPEEWREADLVVCRQDVPAGVRARCFLVSGEGKRALETAARIDESGIRAAATGGQGHLLVKVDPHGNATIRRER